MVEIEGRTTGQAWPAAWTAARKRLQRELGDAVFDAWIGPLTLEGYERDELRIGTTKSFMRNWVAERYVARIERALRAEGVQPSSISIVLTKPQAVIGGNVAREQAVVPSAAILDYSTSRDEAPDAGMGLWTRMLHPQQTFESFVPGAANEFGHRAMRAFAEGTSNDFPHLFIHGGFGYGKTHLLNAAALEFRNRG